MKDLIFYACQIINQQKNLRSLIFTSMVSITYSKVADMKLLKHQFFYYKPLSFNAY